MEREFKIKGLMMDPVTNSPIVIGVFEANAIALQIERIDTPRPMTHDLLRNVFFQLHAEVEKIVVTDLKENTFYALIYIILEGENLTIDSRPSDAIALALRTDAPIYVTEQVIESSQNITMNAGDLQPKDVKEWLENLSSDDLGKYKM
jgi:bifunctional DNase/RNase